MTDKEIEKMWSRMINIIVDRDVACMFPYCHFKNGIDRVNFIQLRDNLCRLLSSFYSRNIEALQDPQKILDKKRAEVLQFMSITTSNLVDDHGLDCSEEDLIKLKITFIGEGIGVAGSDNKLKLDPDTQEYFHLLTKHNVDFFNVKNSIRSCKII